MKKRGKVFLYHHIATEEIPSLYKRFENKDVLLQLSARPRSKEAHPWSVSIETDNQEIIREIEEENKKRSEEMNKSFLA